MTSTRITGGILVLLLISILSFEVAGMGISSYIGNTAATDVNYLAMILEAIAIGVIAIVLLVTLHSLFTNTSSSAKNRKLAEKVSADLQKKHKAANQAMLKIHEHEKSVYSLVGKLHQRFEVLDKLQSSAEERGAELEQTAEKLQSHERDLRLATDSIGNRLNHVQTYWDEQLEDTVDTVQRIRASLGAGLSQVDNSMGRLKEQELMSQQFTKKLVQNYEQQAVAQKENNQISSNVRQSLEATLDESNQLLQHLQKYHQDAENTFKNFSNNMDDYEARVYEQFEDVFASTDTARQELQAGVDEAKQVVDTLKSRDKEVGDLSQQVNKQLETLEVDRVDIMTRALKDAETMYQDIKQDVNKTQGVLYGLKSLDKKTNGANGSIPKELDEITTNELAERASNNVEELDITTKEKPLSEEENKLISFFSRR